MDRQRDRSVQTDGSEDRVKQYLVTASEMKRYDSNTINKYQIPSLLLMERAALVTVEELQKNRGNSPCSVLVAAGCGNNGGDGLAAGRLLMLQGYDVTCVLLGDEEKCTPETARQLVILREYQAPVFSTIPEHEYDIVIDAIFGIGLSRPVEGICKEAIEWINRSGAFVCSVDIPSGIHADTGKVMGCAVQADLTVTYGFYKLGHMLYPGTVYAGKPVCCQMGIDERSFLGEPPVWYTYTGSCNRVLPDRCPDGNKGTFGKTLIMAGSKEIAGAAMMAAKSALRAGAGMVKTVTAAENRIVLQQYVPEAMVLTYDNSGVTGEKSRQALREAEQWADCILAGPGMGMGLQAQALLRFALTESRLPLVLDADALTLLAQDQELQEILADQGIWGRTVILTPHPGEFARLYGCTVQQLKEHITEYPGELSRRLHCVIVCKDARTIVVWPGQAGGYLNVTGNSGMATAGSGDVLAGMIAGLLAQGMKGEEASAAGVYLHGTAGDLAAAQWSETAMTASDIIERIGTAVLLQDRTEKGLEREA